MFFRSHVRRLAAALGVLAVGTATAQQLTPTTVSENAKLLKSAESVTPYGIDLFGDKVNLYNGGLEFVQVDVSLRGNNALPVMAGRRLVTGDSHMGNLPFRE